MQATGEHECCGEHIAAGFDLRRLGFAGEALLINTGQSADHGTIDRDGFAGTDDDDVLLANSGQRDGYFDPAPHHPDGMGLLDEAMDQLTMGVLLGAPDQFEVEQGQQTDERRQEEIPGQQEADQRGDLEQLGGYLSFLQIPE
jgi:hypothetical protein